MSKIQDAIRRLQADRPNFGFSVDSRNDGREAVIARVRTPETGDGTTKSEAKSLRRVEVNRALLKRLGFLPPEDQEKRIADQYRLVKRPLLDNAAAKQAHKSDDANLILVTSALPGDGKTFNCINLSLSMAVEQDTSVLLVDADVAKPHISRLFGLDEEPGLIDLLTDRTLTIDDVALPTDIPGLTIIPAGHHNEHATELLASRRMESVVKTLSQSYRDRITVFDSPPLLATSEARVLADLVGQIVLVVCAGRTPQSAVVEAIENLDESKAINLVLNQSSFRSDTGLYGAYGYGESSIPD